MKFLTKTFSARKHSQVRVTFSQSTNVKLVSKRNLDKYRKSQTHTYWGGKFDNSPVVFDIPSDGQWCVIVEKGTQNAPKEIEASVELVSGGLDITALPGGGSVPKPKKNEKQRAEEEAVSEVEKSSKNEEKYNEEDEMTSAVEEFSVDDDTDSKSE